MTKTITFRPRRALRLGALLVCMVGLIAILGATSAAAKTIKPYVFSGVSFTGADSTAGSFATPTALAVNNANGNVYVLDAGHGGVVSQFSAAGTAVPFSGLGGNSSIAIGTWNGTGCGSSLGEGVGMAVDNTGGATQGNVYISRMQCPYNPLIFGFKPDGQAVNSNFPVCGLNCGKPEIFSYPMGALAVDKDGDLWIGTQTFLGTTPGFTVNPIDHETGDRSLTKDPLFLGSFTSNAFNKVCCEPGTKNTLVTSRAAFDSQENLYLVANLGGGFGSLGNSRLVKYGPGGELLNGAVTPILSGSFSGEVAVDTSNDNVAVARGDRVEIYSPSGQKVDHFGTGLKETVGVAINPVTKDLYLTNRTANNVQVYKPGPDVVVPTVTTGPATGISTTNATLTGVVDPDGNGNTTECFFEYGKTPDLLTKVPCSPGVLTSAGGPQAVTAAISELSCNVGEPGFCFDEILGLPPAKGINYHYRLVTKNAAGPQQAGEIKTFRNASAPKLTIPTVKNVNTDSVDVAVNVDPEGGVTKYRVEYGTSPAYGDSVEEDLIFDDIIGRPDVAQDVVVHLEDLAPGTTFHYKVVAESLAGTAETADRTFRTFTPVPFNESCPNALSRQQAGATGMLNCRSYELVSAADQNGYSVATDLVPGHKPYAGYPDADGRVLYGIHAGGIPDTGSPTNRGTDPYLATRGENGWSTRYVGIPVSGTPSAVPFASTVAGADSSLESFAFGGPDICSPCFDDGSAGLPLRLSNGQLVQGMAGSLPVVNPEPAGTVRKPLSDDGSHFVFGSTQKFEADATAGQLTIYDRNLDTGTTKVVSKTPGGANMTAPDIAQLDISADGSRILLGDLIGTDAKSNEYFHLYMNVGAAGQTIDLTPGTTTGARYNGMTSDGTEVLFTTKDPLQSDGDSSADLYRASVSTSSSTLSRVSTGSESTGDGDACAPAGNWNTPSGGPNCDVVAIAGGGGVASEGGGVFFFSPEKLDGAASGTAGQPNLYIAEPGSAPEFVVTLETANPAVVHGIASADTRNTADFQVNTSGEVSAFVTSLPLKADFENRSFSQVYRYDTDADQYVCVSCPVSNAPGTGNAGLATKGLSITDDGRIFFNSRDALVLRDSNNIQDAYEWDAGSVELISTGTDSNDSSLLTVTSDGVDALFFTREKLVAQDLNGPVVKVYDARESGGFFVSQEEHPCKASDECHGAGTEPAPLPTVQSTQGTDGQSRNGQRAKPCRKGFKRKNGKCVRKKPGKKKKGARR